MASNLNRAVVINSAGTAMTVTAAALALAVALTTAGSGGITLTSTNTTNVTLPTTGTLATLAGTEALTNKTYNGNTWTAGTGTLTISAAKVLAATASITLAGTDGKTLTVSNSLALAGTDGTVMTFPTTPATVARTDAAQTFAGVQTFSGTVDALNTRSAQQALTSYLLPSDADKWRGIYRAGFDHAFRNQQWGGPFGGEMLDAATGTLYRTEFASSSIVHTTDSSTGNAAGNTYRAQGIKVPETQTVAAVWLKLYKTGNPTNNLGVFIYTDSAGQPNALHTNGTATAQSGKLVTSDSTGAWYRFVFATPPTLTGGTQYHIVAKSSGAVDGSNYWKWLVDGTAKTYPFGNLNTGDATPTWTALTTAALCHLVELSATAQISQSSGVFDGKLAFGGSGASGTLSMSRGLCSSVPLLELLDTNEFTLRVVGNAFTKDATIIDVGFGQDHDRVVLRSAVTTGYATLTVYGTTGTVYTVTGSTDVSSGNQDIAIHVRAKADGSDKVELYVNGASQGTPLTSQTITFDANFRNLGTMWVGGGFALAPTYSGSSIGINGFSGLPSTLGWTFAGVGTEANQYSVSGGKLIQNKNGFASTDYGTYTKTTAGLSNANGWAFTTKLRVVSNTNTKNEEAATLRVFDGAKVLIFPLAEYYINSTSGLFYPQYDFKSKDTVVDAVGKGSDYMIFANHKLLVDGSANMTSANASNQVLFGDNTNTAGENADAMYSRISYYTTAWTPPQFTSGSISELAIWAGDRTSILASLYNAGALVSVKQYCGLPQNYLDKSGKLPKQRVIDITNRPSTASTSLTAASEMSVFALAETATAVHDEDGYLTTTAGGFSVGLNMDGAAMSNATGANLAGGERKFNLPATGVYGFAQMRATKQSYLGLHVFTGLYRVTAGTETFNSDNRALEVEPKV